MNKQGTSVNSVAAQPPAAKRKFGTRQLSVTGMLTAVSVVLGLSGLGFVPLLFARATIMHIPVIIGAILEGPLVGALIGLLFGLFSIIQNIMAPSVLSFAFLNPLVSVLPRILIGITSYYSYRLLFRSRSELSLGKIGKIGPRALESIRIGFGAIIGSITNTFGVLTMIYLLYAQGYAEATNIATEKAAAIIYGIALTNGVPEFIIAALVTIPVVYAVRKIRK